MSKDMKLIFENWRKLKENAMGAGGVAFAPGKKEALEEAFNEALENSTLDEGAGSVLAAFMAIVGLGTGEVPPDMQGIEVNGKNYELIEVAQAHSLLNHFDGKPDHEKHAEAGQEDLVQIVKDAIAKGDPDGDGYFGSADLKNFDTMQRNFEVGEAYANMALEKVDKPSEPENQDQAGPEMPEDLSVEKGKSPQGKAQLTVKHKPGKRLSNAQLQKIAQDNGLNPAGLTVNMNTGQGMLVITQASVNEGDA